MSKRIIAVFMLACMLCSMAACDATSLIPGQQNKKPVASSVINTTATTSVTEQTTTTEATTEETTTSEETTSEETTKETTKATTSETTTEATTKAATPTPKPIGKTTVTNAYSRTFTIKNNGKFTTKYPKVTIKGVSTAAVNKEIANKFKAIAKKNESVVKYSYYIGKKYVSILVTVNLEAGKDGSEYYVYNISRVTGKKLTKAEMLKLLNIKSSAFDKKVKTGVTKWWNTNILKNDKSSNTKKMYNNAIAAKSISSAVPFVNTKGKTCFLLRQMKAPTQAGVNDIYATI